MLGISFLAKIADHVPVLDGSGLEKFLKDSYEYLRDMSLLIATGGVAYITNMFQKRSSFVEGLKEEWRDIIATKSALFAYTQLERPTLDQYIATFCKLSETIDNMRSVYQNVGETGDLIGLYPYAPLHDMRRALQTLDPRKNPAPDTDARNLVRDAILQSFYALRETFLEELDLEEPDHPLLISSGRRAKKSGSTGWRDARPGPPARPPGSRSPARSAHRRDAGPALRQGERHRQALAPAGGRSRCIRAERPRRRVGCVKRSADTTPPNPRLASGHRYARPDLRATRRRTLNQRPGCFGISPKHLRRCID